MVVRLAIVCCLQTFYFAIRGHRSRNQGDRVFQLDRRRTVPDSRDAAIDPSSGYRDARPGRNSSAPDGYFDGGAGEGAKDCRRSLLILRMMPALRSATSLTLYSAAEPKTCATSEGVSL